MRSLILQWNAVHNAISVLTLSSLEGKFPENKGRFFPSLGVLTTAALLFGGLSSLDFHFGNAIPGLRFSAGHTSMTQSEGKALPWDAKSPQSSGHKLVVRRAFASFGL